MTPMATVMVITRMAIKEINSLMMQLNGKIPMMMDMPMRMTPFVNDPTQWNDTDGDGYGDEANGNSPMHFLTTH